MLNTIRSGLPQHLLPKSIPSADKENTSKFKRHKSGRRDKIISTDTLHFYNKIGLLVPDHIDPDNQYRYYSLRNLWQLDIITTCRKLNIPLETVREILAFRKIITEIILVCHAGVIDPVHI